MKRFVKFLVLPIALLLGHTLIYSSGRVLDAEYPGYIEEYSDEAFYNVPFQKHATDLSYGEDMTAYRLHTRAVRSVGNKTLRTAVNANSANNFKRIQSTVTGTAFSLFQGGNLLNSNKLYDFLNNFSYHTSGVRASVDRLFTLGSVRC
jgi:hypothetical protein